jgi:hypothetical protein
MDMIEVACAVGEMIPVLPIAIDHIGLCFFEKLYLFFNLLRKKVIISI